MIPGRTVAVIMSPLTLVVDGTLSNNAITGSDQSLSHSQPDPKMRLMQKTNRREARVPFFHRAVT